MLSARPPRGTGAGLISLPRRQRKQAGHTNRWQLGLPPPGDLLGQAQAKRATKTGIHIQTSQRSTKSADTLRQGYDDAPCLLPPVTADGLCTETEGSARSANPEHEFYVVSRHVVQNAKPDAVLECLGSTWELHFPFLCTSDTLSELYLKSKRRKAMKASGETSETERRVSRSRGGTEMRIRETEVKGKIRGGLACPVMLRVSVCDLAVTKESLSFALRTLYNPDECPDQWGEAVLASATLLGLPELFQRCLEEMTSGITSSTVCTFHRVSCEYRQTGLQQACERWLELFLTTELSYHVELKDLTFDVLLKTLQSPRVFAGSEYELLRTVLYWIYLQCKPSEHTLPSHRTILASFSRAAEAFLEQPLGQSYTSLFQALRLHGITEQHHLEEMQKMNVFPRSWLLLIFSNHFSSIHSGGDMHVTDFSKQAVRFGMIVNEDFCTRTVGLYGFYFLLRASRVGGSEAFEFSIERLRHWDPALTEGCRTTHPFSMRPERFVCYQISVQNHTNAEWQESSTGAVNQVFGLSKRYAKSKVFKVDGLCVPMFVTLALAFPSL